MLQSFFWAAGSLPLQAQQTGGPIYYFPHLAVGDGWQTTITYINYSPQEVTCQTDFLSDDGTPLMVSFAGQGTVVSRDDVLPPEGSVHQETNVELSAPAALGWARATCSGSVKASLLFRLHNSEGVPIAEGGVNATTVPATRFVTFAEQGEGKQGTGVAYANPSDTAALVTFKARDALGETLASVDKTLLPNGHAAHNMAPLFGLSSFTGSLEVTSTVPIVSLSINAEAAPVFSSLPPGELDTAAQGTTTYHFPHLAVGDGWQTTITYINYSSEEVTCQTEFLSDQGSPLMVSFAGQGTVVSRDDVLPPEGSVHQETNVELSAPAALGWARATCSGPVKASLLFRLNNSEGVSTGEAGVNAATVPATRFVTFAEQGEGKQGTGVAYANPFPTAARVTFTAKDEDKQTLASVDKTLLPNGHGAHNMAPLFGLNSFTGSLEVNSTVPIVSLSINVEADPVFSSLPPGELDAADIPGEMLAPANEAAFNDLVVGKRAATTDPTIYVDFVSPGSFKDIEGADIWTGSYTYQNTGSNTGTLTYNYDDGDRCTSSLMFVSTTAATETYICNGGSSGKYTWQLVEIPASDAPDLVVQTPSVDDSSPGTGASFTLSATVSNAGTGESAATTLHYYRSTDATISASDTEVGTDAVEALVASGISAQSVALTAAAPGTYYYGACVDAVTGESDTTNNCSDSVQVTVTAAASVVPSPNTPDLVVGSPSVSDSSPSTGGSFTLSATVSNAGAGESVATTLRYYRSSDATITTSDTEVGTNAVAGLAASATSSEGVELTAPSTPGPYYYGACVDAVTGESDTTNNCSASVEVTVLASSLQEQSAPDLIAYAILVTTSPGGTPPGGLIGVSAGVRNDGDGESVATTLRYYRSSDATITTSDTEEGTVAVEGLAASAATSTETISLTAPSTPGTYYYGACVDAVADESDNTNNCSGSVAVAVQEPEVHPDLVVGSPSVNDNSPETEGSFTLSATVTNSGDAEAATTTLRYYRSTDATITTSDTEVGTDAVGVLSASGTSAESIDLTAPAMAGTYYYGACVDTVTGESSTTNNCSSSVQVDVTEPPPPSTPDLEVGSPSVTDSTPDTGDAFTLSATVTNSGDAEAAATTLRYYRSTDATITTSDTEVGTDAVGVLSASGTSAESIDLTAPATAGTYYYGACVDAVADESDNTNNCSGSVAVAVQEPEVHPDLVVGSPSVNDNSPETEGSFTLSATVTNSGDAEAATTTLRYYRSTDATITTSDTEVGTDAVGVLSASGTSAESIDLTAPATAGTYYYGACVDAVADESDNTNNCSGSVAVAVQEPEVHPDLVVGSPSVNDNSPETEGSFTLSATVTNSGDAEAAATTLRYYRSTDATITTSDTEVGTDAVGVLSASGTSAESIDLTAPATAGTYYYGACVDAVADESDNTNNCSGSVAVAVQEPEVHPDLVVGSPSVNDNSPETEGSFTLSATVTNSGDAEAAATTLRYYRSTDATITTSDTEVGTDAVGVLSASGTSAESIDLTAPATAGTYYYGACVDAVTDESSTTNNCSGSVTLMVQEAQPDLTVTLSITPPSGGIFHVGSSFGFGATVTNSGDAEAAATTLRYYQSKDAPIRTPDTQVGTDAVGALAAPGTSAESISLTAPSTPGKYYYNACVDAVAGESNTTNNCSFVSIVVTVLPEADLVVGSPSVTDNSPETGRIVHAVGDGEQRRGRSLGSHDAALLPVDRRDDIECGHGGRDGRGEDAGGVRDQRGVDFSDRTGFGGDVLLRGLYGRGERGVQHHEQLLEFCAGHCVGAAASDQPGPDRGVAFCDRQHPGYRRLVHRVGDGEQRRRRRIGGHDAALLPVYGLDDHDVRHPGGHRRRRRALGWREQQREGHRVGAVGGDLLLRSLRGHGDGGIRHDQQLLEFCAGHGIGGTARSGPEGLRNRSFF